MNRKEVEQELKKAKVPTKFYNLDGTGRDDERCCLITENAKWVVYYSKRGFRTTERFFDTEEEARRYILEALTD